MDAHLSTSLQASLGSGYTLVGELGGGSMSRVFVAEEHALGRRVVVKVLPHYLATEVSLERFRREIQLAAQLQHPLIVPVLSAGESDGMRYYTMPYIAGESLRVALARRNRLSVEHVITILQDVASALAYAHRRGVVHRDIKPDNILLSEDHALVTDFGVAKALESASVRHLQVTSDGEAVGTAAYMAPEQVTGDANIDHRVDIYALGIVAYELLTGHPPFTGQSLHGILTAHLADDPVPPVDERPEIGEDLSDLVLTCLAKKPEDRWQSADQLLETLEGFGAGSRRSLARVTSANPTVEHEVAPTPAIWGSRHGSGGNSGGQAARSRSGIGPAHMSGARRRRRWMRLAAFALGGGLVAATATLLILRQRDEPVAGVPAGAVAVLPFRVIGADSALGYLREGMVDLLTAKLGGGGAARHALDPRSVLNAWRQATGPSGGDLQEAQAVAIARKLGAQRVVLGGVVGTPGRLVLTATLRNVATGESTSAEVSGSPDSLLTLVDRLAARLLALDAGVDRTRLADATSRSLPALKEYLAGQVEYRRGSVAQARDHFRRALELDSTFALAALGNAAAGAYGQSTEAARRAAGVDLAWRLRSRLTPRDQALFDAYVPARYPRERTAALDLATWQKATGAAPELPEIWYGYADRLFHTGAWLGIDRPWERAAPSFARAVEQDSTFIPPLSHLLEIAINQRDTAQVRRLAALYFPRDSAADEADGVRWRVSVALNDRRLHERVDAEMAGFAVSTLARIMALGQIENIAYEDVERAAATLRTTTLTTGTRLGATLALHNLAINSGQMDQALAALAPLRAPGAQARIAGSFYNLSQLIVLDALYGGGHAAAAEAEVRVLETRIAEPNVPGHEERAQQYADVCTAELWRVRRREFSTVDRSLARLRAGSGPRDSVGFYGGDPDLCAAILASELALVRDTSSTRARALHLDSLMREGPTRYGADFGNLVAARLFERAGDPTRARAALVRRPYYSFPGTLFLAEVLLHRARLATRIGDRADARRSYRHYLALRGRAPDPELRPQVERVERELAALEARTAGSDD